MRQIQVFEHRAREKDGVDELAHLLSAEGPAFDTGGTWRAFALAMCVCVCVCVWCESRSGVRGQGSGFRG